MEQWSKYFFQPKPVEELVKNATIFVDTNVLLAAYQWREITVTEVLEVLTNLTAEKRLKIPEHILFEFSKNRPKEILHRVNEIETIISQLQRQKPLKERVPMLENQEILHKVTETQEQYNEILAVYKDGLIKVRDKLKTLFYEDPTLDKIKEIFDASYYRPDHLEDLEKLKVSAEKRFKQKIPPGYKDDGKEANSYGDFILWAHILKEKNDVILISAEKKSDWVYTDKHNNVISPRRELVEEFYIESDGRTFSLLSPRDFIELIKPNISKEIVEDLDEIHITSSSSKKLNSKLEKQVLKWINATLNEFDPIGIAVLTEENDEYLNEAKQILYILPDVVSVDHLCFSIWEIFSHAFTKDLAGKVGNYYSLASEIYTLKDNFYL